MYGHRGPTRDVGPFSADYISRTGGQLSFLWQSPCSYKAANILSPEGCHEALAEKLVRIWHTLGGSADIYVKYHNTDVHYLAMLKAKGAEVARKLKVCISTPQEYHPRYCYRCGPYWKNLRLSNCLACSDA